MIYFSSLKPFGGMFFSCKWKGFWSFKYEVLLLRIGICAQMIFHHLFSFNRHWFYVGVKKTIDSFSHIPRCLEILTVSLALWGLIVLENVIWALVILFPSWRMLSDHWFYLAEFRNSDSNLFSKLFSIPWSVDLCEFFYLVFYIYRADTDLPKWFLPFLCRHQNFLSLPRKSRKRSIPWGAVYFLSLTGVPQG